MAKSINDAFVQIIEKAIKSNVFARRTTSSYNWYQRHIKRLKLEFSKKDIFYEKNRQRKQIQIGQMYTFVYNPKNKKELPYYDVFPLIFPIEKYSDGFLGINLHYLPPILRASLMDKLYDLANIEVDEEGTLDPSTKLEISYEILKSFNKYKLSRVCFKKYLYSHVRTNFTVIKPNEWDIAIFLPTENFKKVDKQKVWRDSRKKIKKL